MKRFKAQQAYLVFMFILSVFIILPGCGGGGGGGGHWDEPTAPTVTSTDPADIATGVCVNKIVTATFSKAMDASTITAAGTFTVKETVTGNNKPGVVTYNATTKTATFTRTTNYTAGLSYTATITTAAKDTEGNALAANKVWSFTTGTTVCANPSPPGTDPASCAGPGPLDLGSAATFGVLAGTALTLTNPQVITGDVGSPSITPASGPSTLVGTMYDSSPASELTVISTAVTDMETAVGCAVARACDFNYAGATDFGGMTLAPGVHCVTGAMSVGSNLTLSTPGVYIFRSTGALTSAATITVAYGGSANVANSSVFWVSQGAASGVSIGATNTFLGTIICSPCAAGATIGANTTLIPGRVLSSAAVTLNGTNQIDIP